MTQQRHQHRAHAIATSAIMIVGICIGGDPIHVLLYERSKRSLRSGDGAAGSIRRPQTIDAAFARSTSKNASAGWRVHCRSDPPDPYGARAFPHLLRWHGDCSSVSVSRDRDREHRAMLVAMFGGIAMLGADHWAVAGQAREGSGVDRA